MKVRGCCYVKVRLEKVRDYGNGPLALVHQVDPEEVRLSMNQRAKGLCSPREAGIRLSALAFPCLAPRIVLPRTISIACLVPLRGLLWLHYSRIYLSNFLLNLTCLRLPCCAFRSLSRTERSESYLNIHCYGPSYCTEWRITWGGSY